MPALPAQVRAWSQKVQNDNQVRRAWTLPYVQVETLQSSLHELRLPRHAGILWKVLKWQIGQFPSFLATINLSGWLVTLYLWMRAFELNVSLLIRKRRLGDNDICWLWKEKTSNQHILTRQGLCFLAVLHFDFSMKLWTWCEEGSVDRVLLSGRPAPQGRRVAAGSKLSLCRRVFQREGRSWPTTPRQEPLLCGYPHKMSWCTYILVRIKNNYN